MARDLIVERLMNNARTRKTKPALYFLREGKWESLDWAGYAERCKDFAGALLAAGHAPHEAVAIIGDNCVEWLIADVGAMVARGVPAGIYPSSTAAQAAYIANHCEAKVVVVEHEGHYAKLVQERANLPHMRKIVMIRGADKVDDPMTVSFDHFVQGGRAKRSLVDARFLEIQDDDLATLIYTSGTTGPPKAAMLSHANLAFMAGAAVKMNDANDDDCGVSYLPLSHVAEQMLSIHVPITAGQSVYCAGSMDRLKETLVVARPTVFLGVPRVWEKFRAALEGKLGQATGMKRRIVAWSRAVGLEAGRYRMDHGEPRGVLALKERIANKLFFSKLKTQLGLDRLRIAVSGAAPIGKDVLEFFLSCGITIHEVYGQTEGSGAATYNGPRVGDTRFGTVGKPIDGVTVKLADDGEILVKGPSVFLGYYKDEAATKETVKDGWLHSGDVGEIDHAGFLRITDRKKDIIVTAGGKNVAPQNLEALLRTIAGIGQAVVIGDKRKYLVALLTLDPDKSAALAKEHGWPSAPKELTVHPAFAAHVQQGLDAINGDLARYESVKKFVLLPDDFSVASGELTPTQKIKRKVVCEKYSREIEGMYAASTAADLDARARSE